MLLFFISAAAALIIVILIQKYVNRKLSFRNIKYSAYFSSSEVYAGDYVYLYEEISNNGSIPVSYMKADTELPDGLSFVFLEDDTKKAQEKVGKKQKPAKGFVSSAGVVEKKEKAANADTVRGNKLLDKRHSKLKGNVQSLFVLTPGTRIRRRWRVYCKTRGEYTLKGVLLTQGDLLGFDMQSKRIEPDDTRRISVTVLPVPQLLEEKYTSSRYLCGDLVSKLCPVSDPLRICGSREYTFGDPMNRINWKSTAVHGKLMVNVEEKTVRYRFSVILNMNSKEIEFKPDTPSDSWAIERSIIACASVMDRIAAENMAVKLYTNTPPDESNGLHPMGEDETGSLISCSDPYKGKRDMIFALRTLAKMPLKISLPAEKFFDHIASHPELYSENENLVIISSYLDARMANLSKIMAEKGVKLSFYITTSRNLLGYVPSDIDAWFQVIE